MRAGENAAESVRMFDKKVVDRLRWRMSGSVIVPTDAEYDSARRVWNGMIDKHPALITRCRDVDDVVACVRLGGELAVPVSIRGGGHNVAGTAICEGGLVIDLSPMRSVWVDLQQGVVHIGGGATLGEVDRQTYAVGMATPTGVVSETGYAGLSLHGGVGRQLRCHGLASDNITAVDVVTADGRVIHADAQHHADLLWAVRGGGGGFGVVTAFTARLYPMPAEVWFGMPIFSIDDAPAVLRFMREYLGDAPEELMCIAALWTAPDRSEVPSPCRNAPVLILLASYIGPPEEGERVLAPLRGCRPALADLTARVPWTQAQKLLDEDYPDGRRYYWKSTMIRELSDAVIDAAIEYTLSRPSTLSSIDIWTLGGAFGRAAANDSAFGSRDVSYIVNYESNWDEPEADSANVAWTRSSLRRLEALSQTRTYMNFPGGLEEGERQVRQAYGVNYRRLQALKADYDPHGIFGRRFVR